MPRLETLSEILRQVLLAFPCLEHDTTPWTPMRHPLSHSKLALVTTAGLHLRSDTPFISDPQGGDASYRLLPGTAKAEEIVQSHVSIGFDRTAIYRDLNVTLPIDRLQELVRQGVVGSLAQQHYSFMGAIRNPRRLIEETGPEVAQRLQDEGVEVVLLTPT
jgi:D-proline reductase (dithiol) PrdB